MFSFAIFVLPIVINAESTEAMGMDQANPLKLNAEFGGNFTFYNDKRIATCGKGIFANYEILAAVSGEWFADSPLSCFFLCKACLKVDYNQIELSLLAYRSLEAVKNWRDYGATFAFVACPDLFTLMD
uniref:Exported protein n=1 Tax=Panagrellus redivivus TaxID=6233 RepID=A0A7E4VIC8_PANRE